MNIPVFDLHCDTAYALLGSSLRACGSLSQNEYHIDLTRADKLDGYAQVFACYSSTVGDDATKISPTELFEREMVSILREIERNRDKIELCYGVNQVQRCVNNGKTAAMLSIEGPAGFGFDPELLEDLYQVGFRMTTLCWNESNPLTGSHKTGGGLTQLGKAYVQKAQQLGMIVDVSHISDEAFWDIMDITTAPVIASHSNSRTVHQHTRNITDEMFNAICATGGVVGINLFTELVGGTGDLDALCAHFLHFIELDPTGRHVCLGGDLDGCAELVSGFDGIQSYPILAQKLMESGFSEDAVKCIFWDNAVEVMKRCCM